MSRNFFIGLLFVVGLVMFAKQWKLQHMRADARKSDPCFVPITGSGRDSPRPHAPSNRHWWLARCDRDGIVHFRAEYAGLRSDHYVTYFTYTDAAPIKAIDYDMRSWETSFVKVQTTRGLHVYLFHPLENGQAMSVLDLPFDDVSTSHLLKVLYQHKEITVQVNEQVEHASVGADGRLIRHAPSIR